MSHELRTPLNAILGFSNLMARDRSLSAEQQENLGIISRSGKHLLSLINGVLDMVKIESGRMTLQEHAFDLHALLNSLAEMFRQRATDKGLTLIVEGVPDVPRYIVADEGTGQILINLLGNAIKFTDGRHWLASQSLVVRTEGSLETSKVCGLYFEVQDTGPGIEASDLEAVFEPFVQSTSGKNLKRTGLGLPISRQLRA
jgi:signal transduction histidine kinase